MQGVVLPWVYLTLWNPLQFHIVTTQFLTSVSQWTSADLIWSVFGFKTLQEQIQVVQSSIQLGLPVTLTQSLVCHALIDDTLARIISCAKPLHNDWKCVISVKQEAKWDEVVVESSYLFWLKLYQSQSIFSLYWWLQEKRKLGYSPKDQSDTNMQISAYNGHTSILYKT